MFGLLKDSGGARAPSAQTEPTMARRATRLAAMASASTAAAEGAYAASVRADELVDAAKAALGSYMERAGNKADPVEVARLQADVDEAVEARTLTRELGAAGIGTVAVEIHNAVQRWMGQLGNAQPRPEPVKPDGRDIGELRSEDNMLAAEQTDLIENSVPPFDETWPRVEQQFNLLVEDGAPRCAIRPVATDSRHVRGRPSSTVKVEWPTTVDWKVPTTGDEPFSLPNIVALVAWSHGDMVRAALRRSLEESYADHGGPIISGADKAKRLRELQGRRLDVQRQIADRAWKLIDAGDHAAVAYLAGLDVQAVLQVRL